MFLLGGWCMYSFSRRLLTRFSLSRSTCPLFRFAVKREGRYPLLSLTRSIFFCWRQHQQIHAHLTPFPSPRKESHYPLLFSINYEPSTIPYLFFLKNSFTNSEHSFSFIPPVITVFGCVIFWFNLPKPSLVS